MNEQKQDDQLEPIYNSSVLINDVAMKTFRERWTIGTGGERESQGDMCYRRDMMIMIYIYICIYDFFLNFISNL